MLLVQQKTIGLTTLRAEKRYRAKMLLVQQKTIGLTTLRAENAVSPGRNPRTNNATGRKCC